MALAFDPVSDEFRADPDAFLHRLRTEDPVHRAPDGTWIVTRYDDATSVLREGRFVSRHPAQPPRGTPAPVRPAPGSGLRRMLAHLLGRGCPVRHEGLFEIALPDWIFSIDPPDHEAVRGALSAALGPALERVRPRVRPIADSLLDRLRSPSDLVLDFARPFPILVLAELLGIPVTDHPRLLRWLTLEHDVFDLGSNQSDEAKERAGRDAGEIAAYLRELLAAPDRLPPDSVFGALARMREAGRLTERDVLANAIALLFAGQETTVASIAAGVLLLLGRPDALELLRDRRDARRGGVEEVFRLASPASYLPRFAREAVPLRGRSIAPGDTVHVLVRAANRDPGQFPDPDRFVAVRHPNPHLAFGLGSRYCLGASLSRLETEVALGSILERLEGLAPGKGTVSWKHFPVWGPRNLPILFDGLRPARAGH